MRVLSVANRHPRLRVGRRSVAGAIAALDAHAAQFRGGCPPGELSVAFLTDAALARLHGVFLGDPSRTDVITFAGDRSLGMAGEICVSADAAERQAAGRRGGGVAAELALYVVHGWLHLAGFDDRDPAARRSMRGAEARALRLLRAAGALPRLALRGFSVPSTPVRA
jgi:probable rRNA maturation factor